MSTTVTTSNTTRSNHYPNSYPYPNTVIAGTGSGNYVWKGYDYNDRERVRLIQEAIGKICEGLADDRLGGRAWGLLMELKDTLEKAEKEYADKFSWKTTTTNNVYSIDFGDTGWTTTTNNITVTDA